MSKIISMLLAKPKLLLAGGAGVLLLSGWIGIKSLNTKLSNCRADLRSSELLVANWNLRYDAWARDSVVVFGEMTILQESVDLFVRNARDDSIAHAASIRIAKRKIDELTNELSQQPNLADSLVRHLRF